MAHPVFPFHLEFTHPLRRPPKMMFLVEGSEPYSDSVTEVVGRTEPTSGSPLPGDGLRTRRWEASVRPPRRRVPLTTVGREGRAPVPVHRRPVTTGRPLRPSGAADLGVLPPPLGGAAPRDTRDGRVGRRGSRGRRGSQVGLGRCRGTGRCQIACLPVARSIVPGAPARARQVGALRDLEGGAPRVVPRPPRPDAE